MILSKKKSNYLQADQSVDAGHDVIEHDSHSAVNMLVEPGHGEWFCDIEDPEQNKGQQQEHRMGGDCDQCNQHADDLVDDYTDGINLVENLFSGACC